MTMYDYNPVSPSLDNDKREEREFVVGTIIGLVLFVALAVFVVLGALSHWHSMVAARRAHPIPGWVVHQGTVVSVAPPNFNAHPPEIPAVIQFVDYYGATRRASRSFSYGTTVGKRFEVDVNRDGSIYAPASFEDNYDTSQSLDAWKGPRAAASTGWPGAAIVFGLVAAAFLSWAVGAILVFVIFPMLPSVPNPKGRLGTR